MEASKRFQASRGKYKYFQKAAGKEQAKKAAFRRLFNTVLPNIIERTCDETGEGFKSHLGDKHGRRLLLCTVNAVHTAHLFV